MKRTVGILAAVLLLAQSAAAQGFTMRFSGDIVVPRGMVQQGTAMTMNGRIQVDGTLRGDAITMNGDVSVSGTVTGSVRTFNGTVFLASTARVGGGVWAPNGRVEREPGAEVGGNISQGSIFGNPPPPQPAPTPPPAPQPWQPRGYPMWPAGLMRALAAWALLGFIVLAAFVTMLFPAQIGRIAHSLNSFPGQALLAGIVLWVVLPPLVLALVLSVVGIPAVVFLPLALTVLGLVGFSGAAMLIGERLTGAFRQEKNPVLDAVVGAALLGVLAFVPGPGWLGVFLAVTWGIGGVLLLLIERARKTPPAAA